MSVKKAAIIGAGSTYTPEIIEGFIERLDYLPFESFYLMDIDETRLEIVGGLARRMFDRAGYQGEVVLTTDLDRALDGADYVFGQIRVGGMQARIRDEKIPLKYGLLGQETTGAGGLMNALRTVPVILDIARRMERLCPDAQLINFSNPSGIVAEAVINHSGIRMVGLCNCAINMLASIKKKLGHDDFGYDYLGLNHLSWITAVRVDGENILKALGSNAGGGMKNIPQTGLPDDLQRTVGAIPSSYLSYFYRRDEQLKHCAEAEKTRGEVCVELEKELFRQYADPNLAIKPPELAQRGGALYSTAAISLVDAIENDKREYHVVNVRNDGAMRFLEDGDVVEVKCVVGRDRIEPVPVNTDNPFIIGLIQSVKAYERLAVRAALEGSRDAALAALMVHPLIGDYARAKGALDEMIAANIDYLPQFRA